MANLVANSFSSTSITLTWELRSGGTGGISNLRISMMSNDFTLSAMETSRIFNNLFPKTEYQFSVIAMGPLGNSFATETVGRTLSYGKKKG